MRRKTRIDVAVLAVLTVALRAPAYVADKHLTFDDGVYGASALAMRAGGRPFAEVFSSQGPLFLPLVWLADAAGFRTANAPRLLGVASGVAVVLGAYALGRMAADRTGALLAAGLVGTSIGLLGVTGPVAADGPALAFGTGCAVLALRWRRAPSVAHAALIGLAAGAALSIKSLVLPAVIPAALVLLAWRRPRLVVAGAATALAFHVAVAVPWGLGDVWDQSYAYHLEVAGDRTPVDNLAKTASTLGDREGPLLVAGVLAAGAWLRTRRPRDAATSRPAWLDRVTEPAPLLWAWLLAMLAVLVLEHPLWRPHVAHLVIPGAVLAARRRPPSRVLAAALLAVAVWHVPRAWFLLHPDPYRGDEAAVVGAIRALPEGALAISDEPGIFWRAGRRTTDDLVDTSSLRIEAGHIDGRVVAEAATQPAVCAVAVRSQRWGSFDDLPGRLADAGYEVARDGPRGRVLYVKERCRP